MPKVSDAHRAAMRRRILDATMAVAGREGLAGVTMANIISESELSAGAIYGYYKGKDQIVLDIGVEILGGRRDALAELQRRDPVPPPATAIAALLEGMPHSILDVGLLLQFWGAGVADPELGRRAREMGGAMIAALQEYLARWFESCGNDVATASARARLLASPIAGVAQGYIIQRSLGLDSGQDHYVAGITALLEGEASSRRCGEGE